MEVKYSNQPKQITETDCFSEWNGTQTATSAFELKQARLMSSATKFRFDWQNGLSKSIRVSEHNVSSCVPCQFVYRL